LPSALREGVRGTCWRWIEGLDEGGVLETVEDAVRKCTFQTGSNPVRRCTFRTVRWLVLTPTIVLSDTRKVSYVSWFVLLPRLWLSLPSFLYIECVGRLDFVFQVHPSPDHANAVLQHSWDRPGSRHASRLVSYNEWRFSLCTRTGCSVFRFVWLDES
jgi:hypothetical protein